MESQHVKRAETFLKSARQYFCHIYWSLRKKISSKNSVLVVYEILIVFDNKLTPDHKYSLAVKASVSRNQLNLNKLEYSDYLLPFELLYRDIKDLDLPNEESNFLKAKIKDSALSSFKLYNEKGAVSRLNRD